MKTTSTVKIAEKDDMDSESIISTKTLATGYVLLTIVGFSFFMYAHGHGASARHIFGAAAIVITCLGWLSVIAMTRLQNYRYLVQIIARQFKKGRLPLDERELLLRSKVFEQSYTIALGVVVSMILYALLKHSEIAVPGILINLTVTWLFINSGVAFIFLPSLLAANKNV